MSQKILLTLIFQLGFLIAIAQQYQPVEITGFSQDVIAEGSTKDALATTTREMDAITPSNFVLFAKKYARLSGMPAGNGLPDNGKIISRDKTFQLSNYGERNALYLIKGTRGQLKLNRPQRFDRIAILGLATEGTATLNIILGFTDGSSLLSGNQFFPDWFDGADPVLKGFGRVKRVAPGTASAYYEGAPSNPRLYTIVLETPNHKDIVSITFTNTSAGENKASNRALIFAISGLLLEQESIPQKKEVPITITDRTTIIQEKQREVSPEQKKPEVFTPVVEEKKPTPGVKENAFLQGMVADAKTNQPIQAAIQFKSTETINLNTINGKYVLMLETANPVEFSIRVTSPGYADYTEKLVPQSWPVNHVLNFSLNPIEIGTVVKLERVLFKQSTATLLALSYPELDSVAHFLKSNPGIHIELAGHTDNRGSKKSNLKLSKERVEAVKAYLVEQGIASDRIVGNGYGGARPIAPNDTEASRMRNRRVEVTVTRK